MVRARYLSAVPLSDRINRSTLFIKIPREMYSNFLHIYLFFSFSPLLFLASKTAAAINPMFVGVHKINNDKSKIIIRSSNRPAEKYYNGRHCVPVRVTIESDFRENREHNDRCFSN